MHCENKFCVYCSKQYCMLEIEQIEMDFNGICKSRKHIEIDDVLFEQVKGDVLQKPILDLP